jgi:hypothetical protein
LPAWTYWEPVEVPTVEGVLAVELPVDITLLGRTPGADARWTAASRALREAVGSRGFAVTRAAHPASRLGDFYASLRDDRVAWVVTLDALFFLAHLALDRALADVDAGRMAPSIATVLRRLDVRLEAEGRGANADLAPSYLVARGVAAVAIALAQPNYVAPPELAVLVDGEKSRVLAHGGMGVSPWLGIALDYSAMSARGAADRDEAHAGWFRAVAWLQQAALALEGTGEGALRAQVDIATARVHARAALLLSRLLAHEVDAEAASAWERVERASELMTGEADDLTPRDLTAVARAAKLDIRNGGWFGDVAAVDRVRHAAARAHPPHLDDGAGDSRSYAAHLDSAAPTGRITPSFRLFAPRQTPDAEVMQSLVFPSAGGLARAEAPPTARDGVRALPAALDVAAWLGSAEARAALRDAGDDAYARYATTLDRLMRARPPAGSLERHRTPYLSMLDAVETWLGPSAGDRVQPGASTTEWRKRKAEVALGAWTALRHDATAMSRVAVAGVRLPPHAPQDSAVPVFVEPHPEAIAKLVALVRQTSRALVAEGALGQDAPGITVLDEVGDMLWMALGVATHEATDLPVPPALAARLAELPARLRALEAALADAGVADVPLAVDVHTDRPTGRVLVEGLGRVEEAWMVVREPQTHRMWLAVGASIPHAELVEPAGQRPSDGAWRARLLADGDPAPTALERAYLVGPEAAAR